ncbi:hypothetical protein IKF76_01500 [Candidatus Saccharibacteria bacterium]|nr:hypothetical protein [Candidatus Saccharibacteria bacterium]
MDSDNNNQDSTDSAAALKDLTAELENLKAEDLAAEVPAQPTESPAAPMSESQVPPAPVAPETPEATESSESTDMASAAEPANVPSITPPTFDPSTLESTPGISEPTVPPEPTESTDAPTPESAPATSVADFTNGEHTEAAHQSDSESKDQEQTEKEPIKPAAPVPGSIGSAKSYEDYQTDEANRTSREANLAAKEANRAAKEAAAKKTTSTALILGIVIAAILIIAAAIFALITINNKPKNTATNNQPETPLVPEPVFSSITCTKDLEGTELSALGPDAVEATNTITATYYDDELSDISDKTVIEYQTEEAATVGATTLKSAYESTLELLNIATDPFDSTYPVVDSTLTITHLADGETITSENFAMFGLRVNADGEVESDITTIEEIYTEKDFTCVVK